MCLIIDHAADHVVPEDTIRAIFKRNADGFGVMRASGGKVEAINVLPTSADHAVALYQEHASGRRCVVHWRMATHGPKDLAHTHPFEIVPDSLYVMHNGIVAGGSSVESDTAALVRTILRPVLSSDPTLLKDESFLTYLDTLIRGSALVFLDASHVVTRRGNAGMMHGGSWYSNRYAWPAPPIVSSSAVVVRGNTYYQQGWEGIWDRDDDPRVAEADRYLASLRRREAAKDDRPTLDDMPLVPRQRAGKVPKRAIPLPPPKRHPGGG